MNPSALARVTAVVLLLSFPGCSVYKAGTQPGPADLSGLGIGTPRTQVIMQLGPPKMSESDTQGRKTDVYEFVSGFHQGSKARIILYLAADVFTLALAELVLWPMELTVMDKAACIAHAAYDKDQRVETWVVKQKDGVQGC
jgi:outer membrane protein assembly factor BamE (lipoprotein component of BamABCDE complex)